MIGVKLSEKGKQQLKQAAIEKVREIADAIFEESQKNLVRPIWQGHIISDRGELLKTAFIKHLPASSVIIYPVLYAEFVEFGRAPGSYPPISMIEGWAKRKLRVSPKEADKIKFAIAQKIKAEGIAPRPFLRNAVESVSARL